MELAENVRTVKLTKQELLEEVEKQQIDCQNGTVDEMKTLLLRCGKLIGAAQHPSQQDEVQLKKVELEKLHL